MKRAEGGTLVLGVCNGFQTLCEVGLLPGVLMRNASLKFVCREVKLEVVNTQTSFTRAYSPRQVIRCPTSRPSMTNSGRTSRSGVRRVSRTKRRTRSVRRSRRGRR